MKQLTAFVFLVLFLTFPVLGQTTPQDPARVNATMTLMWLPNDPVELLESYNVYYESIGATNQVSKVFRVTVPGVELVNLLKVEPNGVYKVTVTAVNSAGLESDPSFPPIYMFWYGRPTPPKGVVVEIRQGQAQ